MGANALDYVLKEIYRHPKKLQSNFCRELSWAVARLASSGLITTEIPSQSGTFENHWRVTLKGLRVLDLVMEEED